LEQDLSAREGEVEILDLAIILLKRKKAILALTLGATLLSAVVAFLLPPLYRAETRILPPQQGSQNLASQLLGQLGSVAGYVAPMVPIRTPGDLYVEMLRSRTVLDRVVDRFRLMEVYREKYRQDARKRLLKAMRAEEEKKSGIVIVTVEDRNPARSADMANAFVEELKSLAGGLAVSEAAQRRFFFEEQVRESSGALARAEEAVRGFQAKTGAFQIDSQAKAVIESIAELRAKIAAKEVQLRGLRTYTTASNPDLQKGEEELEGLKAELAKFEAGRKGGTDPLLPTGRMPVVGIEYLRRLRDLKFQEALHDLLAKQYEAARLDESRDAVVIQVIDRAVPPEKKAKPRRALIVGLSAGAALLLSVLWAFGAEYVESVSRDPARRNRLQGVV